MKKILIVIIFTAASVSAQFKEELNKPVDIRSGITNHSPSTFLLGFINPQNFNMQHSINMSYSSFGGQGMALGVYTNSMSYNFNSDLKLHADVSFVNSPYSSLGEDHAKQINGIYLSRAMLSYRPSDNFFITLQYNQIPYNSGYYSPYYYDRFSPFYFNPTDE